MLMYFYREFPTWMTEPLGIFVACLENHGNALELAVLSGGNLKKVDKEAIKKSREENKVERSTLWF